MIAKKTQQSIALEETSKENRNTNGLEFIFIKRSAYERMLKRKAFQESFFILKIPSSSALSMVHIPIQHKPNDHNTMGKLHY